MNNDKPSVRHAKAQLEEQLIDDDRVVSIGIGKYGIIVRSTIPEGEEIPDDWPHAVDGHTVDYRYTDPVNTEPGETVATGAPSAQTGVSSRRKSHIPIPGGVSIGHRDVTAGTTGFLLTNGADTYLTSNNHVLANTNNATKGDPVHQPGPIHGGDVVGRYIDDVPIEAGATVDLAWAEINPDVGQTTKLIGLEGPYGDPVHVMPGDELAKTGLNGLDSAEVLEIEASVNVNFGDAGTYTMREMIVTESLSAPGDSGSAILHNGMPAGMNFAGNTSVSVIMTAHNIERESGMAIVTRDAPPATDLEDIWTYRARPDPHNYWQMGVPDGDTYNLVVDQGFGSTQQATVRAKHIDTAEIWGAKDEEELESGRTQRDFARQWMRDAVEMYNTEWPLRIRTYQDEGHYGRLLAEVYNAGGYSLEWALYDEFGDDIVYDSELYNIPDHD